MSLVYDLSDSAITNIYTHSCSRGVTLTSDETVLSTAHYDGIVTYKTKWGETSVSEIPENENIIYPNPATGIVNILLDIKKAETIDVNIYDTSGDIITNIYNGIAEPGTILTWDSSRHPSGTYYCKVESRSFNRTYKIIVSK
jgi:hypothetical protein